MESFRVYFNRLQSLVRAFIGLCMIVMMCVIFIQTATRYLVFYSIPWSEELSRYLYVTLTLLGMNLAISSRQLVRIDIIDNYLSAEADRWLQVIRCALAVIITAVFFYSSFGMIAGSASQSSPAMGISMQIMYTVLGLGFFLSTIAAVFELYDAFRKPAVENQEH